MIRYFFISFFIFTVAFAKAQSRATIDSLWIVKDYLQALQESIPNNANEVAVKIQKLDSLIRLGTQKKIFFDQQLQVVLKHNPKEIKELLRKYDLVLQSAILVKTDVKQNQLATKQTKEEKYFINKNCSFLIDKLYFYANYYKTKIEQNTH